MSRIEEPSDALTPLPAGKFLSLSTASTKLLHSIFRQDRKGALDLAAESFCTLCRAESAAIFLVPEKVPERLSLEAAHSDLEGRVFQPVELLIQSEPEGGLTGHIASIRQTVRMNNEELRTTKYSANTEPRHLRSGLCYSLLGVPLLDRKERLLGLVKMENKKGKGGIPAENVEFTPEDEAVAQVLGNKLSVVLENLRTFEALRDIIRDMHSPDQVPTDILKLILQRSLQLLRADRGDLVLWSESAGDLTVRLQIGESTPLVNQSPPPKCVIRRVWESRGAGLVPDVDADPDYHSCDGRTRSEVAVRLEWNGKHLGVLNAEAFDGPPFDEHDHALLNLLGEYASIAYQVVGREAHYRHIFDHLGTFQFSRGFLGTILDSVRVLFGFDGGIIYLVDPMNGLLSCEAFISAKRLQIKKPQDFSYRLDETAFATWVYHEKEKKGEFVQDPRSDPRFNAKGLDAFQIDGPVIGVPLEDAGQVVGVLIVWNTSGPTPPAPHHLGELAPLARLAAAAINFSASDLERNLVLRESREILGRMQVESTQDPILHRILQAVQKAGFDRGRVFKYLEDGKKFVCLDSVGMPDTARGYTIHLTENEYARDTFERVQYSRQAFTYKAGQFGADPAADHLHKDPDLPWAVVPLVVANRFHGQIVADNSRSRRPIRQESLDYLTLLGALAAHAVANAETFKLLGARKLPILYSRLRMEESRSTVVQQLLVYLTHGDGVGFNRALFLEFREPEGRLVYQSGVGSRTKERFTDIAKYVAGTSLAQTLDAAGQFRDADLDEALDGFALKTNEPPAEDFLRNYDAVEFQQGRHCPWPDLLAELGRRIDARHVLAVPVRLAGVTGSEFRIAGLFIVDSRWTDRPLGEADRVALGSFASLAGQILHQYDLQRRVLESRDLATRGFVTDGLAHQFEESLGNLHNHLGAVKDAVRREDFGAVERSVNEFMEPNVEYLVKTVKALRQLVSRNRAFQTTSIRGLLDDLATVARSRAERQRIKLETRVDPESLAVPVMSELLLQALVNLVANAMDALAERRPPQPRIRVSARASQGQLLLEVWDNGPGIPPDIRAILERAGAAYTSHPERGLGMGLQIVRRAAEMHQGRCKLESEHGGPSPFTRVVLTIPLVNQAGLP
jgi:GAF domain-containing protein/two-component sensor histidine kinase